MAAPRALFLLPCLLACASGFVPSSHRNLGQAKSAWLPMRAGSGSRPSASSLTSMALRPGNDRKGPGSKRATEPMSRESFLGFMALGGIFVVNQQIQSMKNKDEELVAEEPDVPKNKFPLPWQAKKPETEPVVVTKAETENGANGAEVALKTASTVASGAVKVAGGTIKIAGEAVKVAGGAAAFVGHAAPEVAKGISYGVNDVVVPAAQFTAEVIVPTAQRGIEEGSRQLGPILDEARQQTAPVIEPAVEATRRAVEPAFSETLKTAMTAMEPALRKTGDALDVASRETDAIKSQAQDLMNTVDLAVEPAKPALSAAVEVVQGTAQGTMGLAVAATDLYKEGGWGGLASNTFRGLAEMIVGGAAAAKGPASEAAAVAAAKTVEILQASLHWIAAKTAQWMQLAAERQAQQAALSQAAGSADAAAEAAKAHAQSSSSALPSAISSARDMRQ